MWPISVRFILALWPINVRFISLRRLNRFVASSIDRPADFRGSTQFRLWPPAISITGRVSWMGRTVLLLRIGCGMPILWIAFLPTWFTWVTQVSCISYSCKITPRCRVVSTQLLDNPLKKPTRCGGMMLACRLCACWRGQKIQIHPQVTPAHIPRRVYVAEWKVLRVPKLLVTVTYNPPIPHSPSSRKNKYAYI